MSKRGPRFSEKEKLARLKEGKKSGVKAVCAKCDISDQTYRLWRYRARRRMKGGFAVSVRVCTKSRLGRRLWGLTSSQR